MNLKTISTRWNEIIPPSFAGSFSKLFKKNQPSPSVPSVRLACDLGKAKIAFLELVKTGDLLTLTRFHKMPRPKEEKDLVDLVRKTVTELAFQTRKIRIAVKGQGVVVRFIQLPRMKPEELRGAITFEAEKYIPFKSDEVILDYHILQENLESASGSMMNVLLVAVKKEEIYPLLNIYQQAELQVELVDVDALAFINALEYLYPEEFHSSVGILDIGSEITTLGIVKEGRPQFIRDISYGSVDLVKRLKRKLGISVSQALEQLEIDRKPSPEIQKEILEGLGPLIADLKVSLDYYLDQVQPSDSLQKLYLSGGTGYSPVVMEALSKDLGVAIGDIDVLKKIQMGPHIDQEFVKQNQALLPIALGLCLRSV